MYKLGIKDGELVIEPEDMLAAFIRSRHGGHKYNTKLRYAKALRRFIGDTPISEIDADYAIDYLRERSKSEVDINTYTFEFCAIMQFLQFLVDLGYLKDFDRYNFVGLPVPDKKPSNKLNDIKPEYLQLFLQTVNIYQPRIAFAVLLSLASGLRPSELLNLKKSDITCIGPYGKDGWILNVEKRDLRPDAKAGVKKTRRQVAQSMGNLGAELYKIHLEKYTVPDNPALFVDSDGKAMDYPTYYQRFMRFRNHFIEALASSNYPEDIAYADFLSSRRWGPHICRGIFSNDINRNTNNIAELAGARGDNNPGSSITYTQAGAVERVGTLNQYVADSIVGEK